MEWMNSFSRARRHLQHMPHIKFHTIPAIAILAVVAIRLTGIDNSRAGCLCGIVGMSTWALSLAIWLVAFSYAMLVDAALNKQWLFLFVAMCLQITRILWASEVFGNDSSNTLHIWLPMEHFFYYLVIHKEPKLGKLCFFATTAMLYGLCILTFVIAYKIPIQI